MLCQPISLILLRVDLGAQAD